jgi:hypothetical protein
MEKNGINVINMKKNGMELENVFEEKRIEVNEKNEDKNNLVIKNKEKEYME